MKRETQLDKLNALLGLTEKVEEVKVKTTGNVVGITEDSIQTWREIQGLIYFLQAPALFTPKVCKNCGTRFVVSRLYVAFCSYDCITESLREQGIEWVKGSDLETLALDPQVYNGNEPLWVRQPILSRLREMLDELQKMETRSSPTKTSDPVLTGSLTSTSTDQASTTPPTPQPTSEITSPSRTSTSLDRPAITPPTAPTKPSSAENSKKQRRISFQ